jgi:GlpG protein
MRQVGTLPDEREANRFASWLVTQRIDAHAEQEGESWVIWVREEDRLREAREALAHFREHPQDAKYRNAEKSAETLLREEEARRRESQKNVVQMRGRWGTPGTLGGSGVPRRAPLVLLIAGASILAAILTNFGESMSGGVLPMLLFADPRALVAGGDMWSGVRAGEVWRLFTPIFVHFGLMHLVFNLFIFWDFGGQIENRRGSMFFAFLILALAVASNAGQAAEIDLRGRVGNFGGLSGVAYGLFGYMFIKVRYDNTERYLLSQGTTILLLLWFAVCIAAEFPPLDQMLGFSVANSAHAVGFFLGMAIAYVPVALRRAA